MKVVVYVLTIVNFLLLLYLLFAQMPGSGEAVSLIIQAVSAIATLLAVLVAIFQDWIRYIFLPPKLKIELHNTEGIVIPSGGGKKTIFFHLKVVNYRKWSTAKNCEVLLVEIKTELPNKNFRSIPLTVPRNFNWTPADLKNSAITFNDKAVFDLVKIESEDNSVVPCLNRYYRNSEGDFEGFIKQGEVKRYVIQITGDNIPLRKQTFEVTWDGIWPETSGVHLIIEEIVQ